jgi:hypothetical protein
MAKVGKGYSQLEAHDGVVDLVSVQRLRWTADWTDYA